MNSDKVISNPLQTNQFDFNTEDEIEKESEMSCLMITKNSKISKKKNEDLMSVLANPFSDSDMTDEEENEVKMNQNTNGIDQLNSFDGIIVGLPKHSIEAQQKIMGKKVIIQKAKVIINSNNKTFTPETNPFSNSESSCGSSSEGDSYIDDLIVKPKVKKAKENHIKIITKLITKEKNKQSVSKKEGLLLKSFTYEDYLKSQVQNKTFSATTLVKKGADSKEVNIINEVKIFDYVFPMNSSFKECGINGFNNKREIFHLNNILGYKNISTINHDTLEDTYLINVENFSGSNNCITAQMENSKTLTTWLTNCNDKNCNI